MPVAVAMYDKSYDHIQERLDALELDIQILLLNGDGKFMMNEKIVDPADVDVDYMWLTTHLNADDALDMAFKAALGCKSLDLVQTFNAGLDNPSYRKLADKGIRICNSSAQAVAISEYVIGQVLAELQPVKLQRSQQTAKEWKHTPFREISGMNWLIIGYGPIGKAIAYRIKSFGTGVTVVRQSKTKDDVIDVVGTADDLPELLPNADVVVIACPLNAQTRGMADDKFFAKIKQDALFVNIARGAVVEEAALLSALDSGQISTAILDVFHTEPLPADNPLWEHPGVRLTPHTSFGGDGVRGRWDQLFLDNIVRYVNGDTLIQEVNPDIIV